ncbi:MAG: hypothetical protein EZS28_024502 [Streblomastix strix]|uniref:Uncharacterized protein n=1 Tax=Streblomastix strix TaxID=222440 RepID=A0A5J4VBZ1_9EUKA|nr:MAG: hypothetical protein EZS28_024502 [Streblomastix strix]
MVAYAKLGGKERTQEDAPEVEETQSSGNKIQIKKNYLSHYPPHQSLTPPYDIQESKVLKLDILERKLQLKGSTKLGSNLSRGW